MMIADNIGDLLRREPFMPFRVILTSGGSYEIANPALVMVLKYEVFIAFPDGERWAHVPYEQISSVEAVVNGRKRKPSQRKPRR